MAAPMKNGVELAFVENSEAFLLKSRFFPSKFGGKPAWLSLNPIPKAEELSCRLCARPTIFLCQIYSPDLEKEEAFHRTIFMFACRNPECCRSNTADNFHVFRSQLPKINDFYSSDPPVESQIGREIDASLYCSLCAVCGCRGQKICGKCHKTNYCSKEHQTVDWKAGHKKYCSAEGSDVATGNINHNCLFPELELVTETEDYKENKDEKNDDEKMKEYSTYLKSEKGLESAEQLPESELDKMASKETENDKQLRRFKKRLAHEPEQVLRYEKGGSPLWIAHDPVPNDIPSCSCGANRQFEFQVLPQLLSHMKVDELGASLDWGTLCVYTCSVSCSIGNMYKTEYLFKQDIV